MVRVGIVGFGKLGQYLAAAIEKQPQSFTLAFIWNRSKEVFDSFPQFHELILDDLASFQARSGNSSVNSWIPYSFFS